MKLFMVLLGCKPPGRFTEQHDIFFGIAEQLADLKQAMLDSWPEALGKMHIDAWREVNTVGDFSIEIMPRAEDASAPEHRLFFLNLGGYKPDEFEEYHYKVLAVAADKAIAAQLAKQTGFYKHTGFEGAHSHIDDKYGVDVDDMYEIEEILPAACKEKYRLQIKPAAPGTPADAFHLGYLKMEKLV
jgi:Domain of Unknown Function (DUF1543)